LRELGVRLILAGSPQAKGRVERCNGTLQDRLVKALRLKGISDLESANRFLLEAFLPDFNVRFGVEAAAKADLHRRVPRGVDLDRVLSFQEPRVVRNDGTLQWRNRWFQLTGTRRPRPKTRVLVCETLDDRLRVFHGGRELTWEELPERPVRGRRPQEARPQDATATRPSRRKQSKPRRSGKPSADHPWRRRFVTAEGERPSATVVGGGSAPAR
jgi:hypothetical protein